MSTIRVHFSSPMLVYTHTAALVGNFEHLINIGCCSLCQEGVECLSIVCDIARYLQNPAKYHQLQCEKRSPSLHNLAALRCEKSVHQCEAFQRELPAHSTACTNAFCKPASTGVLHQQQMLLSYTARLAGQLAALPSVQAKQPH